MIGPHLMKIRKLKRGKTSKIEHKVCKVIYSLEKNHKKLKSILPRFHINTAKLVIPDETDKLHGKKLIVILYPLRYTLLVRNVQRILISELEKKFPGHVVSLVAQRTITKRPQNVYKLQNVQRSRTKTAVNEGILDDLLYPSVVVARRWRLTPDGSKRMKIYLHTKDKNSIKGRIAAIEYLYKKLTKQKVGIGFMWNPTYQQVSHR